MPRSRARHDRQLEVADLPAHVPLLADVLAVCEGMVVNVEIKNAPQDPGWDAGEAVAALTAAAIEEAGWTTRVIVSSFQMATLRAVQAADGRLALGALWGFAAEVGAGAGGGGGGRIRRRAPLRRCRSARSWSSGLMQWGLLSTCGRSTRPRTCGPWWPQGWTR